ncbi:MAG: HAD-IIB family hydrolase [Deltaproteobacteria bacterium]|nr:HAD-IIB family hydrolase [Deltaproteobacteria bacterium]
MPPLPLQQLRSGDLDDLVGVVTDIDDTLTWEGRLVPAAFLCLARLQAAGLRVVPVTGRPGGWVDHIARMWPVDGVVGENGGLWFYMQGGRLRRRFLQPAAERSANRARLSALATTLLAEVPGAALASDQPYRELDLAVDFCEDVPALPAPAVGRIAAAFARAGATAKVSSIHVNGWYGDFDKWTGIQRLSLDLWGEALAPERWLWFGDSPNDEPLFARFPRSVGVANVARFLPEMSHHPRWITGAPGGHGFAEAVDRVLALRRPS